MKELGWFTKHFLLVSLVSFPKQNEQGTIYSGTVQNKSEWCCI